HELGPGQVRIDERLLVQIAEHGLGALRVAADIDAANRGPAGCRSDETAEHPQQRGLTCAIRANDPEDLTCLDGQADAADGLHDAESLGQAGRLDRAPPLPHSAISSAISGLAMARPEHSTCSTTARSFRRRRSSSERRYGTPVPGAAPAATARPGRSPA